MLLCKGATPKRCESRCVTVMQIWHGIGSSRSDVPGAKLQNTTVPRNLPSWFFDFVTEQKQLRGWNFAQCVREASLPRMASRHFANNIVADLKMNRDTPHPNSRRSALRLWPAHISSLPWLQPRPSPHTPTTQTAPSGLSQVDVQHSSGGTLFRASVCRLKIPLLQEGALQSQPPLQGWRSTC